MQGFPENAEGPAPAAHGQPSRAWSARGRSLLWAGLLLAAAHWPPLVDALPFLALFRAPAGIALLVLALLATLRPWPSPAPKRWPDPPAVVQLVLGVFVVAAGAFVATGLFYSSRLGVSGDEPHYLLMAQSLWREHDLELRDNVARGDWEEFTPRAFAPHLGAPRADGRPFPAHSPGLPALLAPAYAVAGRRGAVVLMGLIGGAIVALVFALARRLSGRTGAALLAAAMTAGPPVAAYSFHLYTEAVSTLAWLVAALLLFGPPSTPAAVAAALAVSLLPWLHLKMAAVPLALAVVAAVRLRGAPRLAFAGAAVLMGAAFLGYYAGVFGTPNPLAVYGGVPSDLSGSPWRAASGLLLDRSFGLLPHAPAFLLAAAGLPALARGASGRALLGVGLAVLAPVLSWRMWWGGMCPPGRFLVPLVPVLAIAAAVAVSQRPRGLCRWRYPLLAFGFALLAFAVHDPEQRLLLNRANRPTRLWAALSPEVPLGRYLPSLTWPDPVEQRVALVWGGALVLLLVCDAAAQRSNRVDRWFTGLGLPVLLVLGTGSAVDLWARSGGQAAAAPASVSIPTAGQRPEATPADAVPR